ncbi:G-patch domain protein [Kalmanozyma brasiliensis GHG001]|uniref:G-patch domain protein n=1 Tax=Kalmanozyma brasiliensis (strain GHG001) TaxID=1365824 RepID=UPI0028681689|nr:G-patch domain protein [Kalmanozyma brasiliensis GHG001]EST05535.2 G-patch domain protein [Kalmanozyma brasiliensis GHG001]
MTQLPSTPSHGLSAKPSQEADGLERGEGSCHRSRPSRTAFDGRTQGPHATLPPSSSSYRPRHGDMGSYQPRYQDRDDPRYAQRDEDQGHHHNLSRRRSKSPDMSRHLTSKAVPVKPWKDLRAPVRDQDCTASNTSAVKASSTMASTSSTAATNKRFANDISRWNRKQSELQQARVDSSTPSLSADPIRSAGPSKPAQPSGSSVRVSQSSASSSKASETGLDAADRLDAANPSQMLDAQLLGYDYKDAERIACLLCQRKFKSLDTLHRHENESQLHRDNLANMNTCRQGVSRHLESKADSHSPIGPTRVSDAASQKAEPQTSFAYRDRASERRAVFGSDTASKQSDSSSNRAKVFESPNKATSSASSVVEVTPLSAPEKPIGNDNVGSKLLAMMGWSQGQGLGAKREGRTGIVETKIYKPGAGLGSSAPTDTAAHEEHVAQSSHRPGSGVAFAGYLDRAKDRARQRLAEHSQPPP